MTTATKTRIREHAVSAALTAIATLFLTFGTGAWSSKESASSHKADVQRIDDKLERILDVVCDSKPAARACTESRTTNGQVAP